MPAPREIEIRECMVSKAGENFGANNVAEGNVKDFGALDAEDQDDAFRRARSWCEGILEAITIDNLSEEEVSNLFDDVQSKIDSPGGLEPTEINQSSPDVADEDDA